MNHSGCLSVEQSQYSESMSDLGLKYHAVSSNMTYGVFSECITEYRHALYMQWNLCARFHPLGDIFLSSHA